MGSPNIPVTLKYVKGRKNYICSTCNRPISKGTYQLVEIGRILGFWINNRYCTNCDIEEINIRVKNIKESLLKERELLINKGDVI